MAKESAAKQQAAKDTETSKGQQQANQDKM